MLSERTRVQIRFLGSLYRVVRWYTQYFGGREDKSNHLDHQYLLIGFAYQLGREWAYDHDYGGVRTSYLRRYSVAILLFASILKLMASITESERESLTVGGNTATVVYRLWYGVLYPLPDIGG